MTDEIVFHDRYTNQPRVEKVYGDQALRWTYRSIGGKIALAAAVKRAWFSRWYGWRMDRPASRRKIEPFISTYELDISEFERSPDQFASFNEFFFRKLQAAARPIEPDPMAAVFPADGRHLCVPDLSDCRGLFVKGKMFDLATLLGSSSLADAYAGGSLLLSRLCPVDYHRFHFPVAGHPGEATLINGPLYSVNPIALRQNIDILATNKRMITELQSRSMGRVLLLEIGATCVGGICQTYHPGESVDKGQEKGFFRFGGSSTITVFPRGSILFDDDLVTQSANQRELYARVGDHLGTIQGGIRPACVVENSLS